MQASTFVMFPDVFSACRAASILRDETPVDAVEMFDRAAVRFVSLQPVFPCGTHQCCSYCLYFYLLLLSWLSDHCQAGISAHHACALESS